MARARKICADPHCPQFQPCPEHQRKPWEGSTRNKTLPRGWAKLRIFILERDGGICQVCRVNAATEVDHIDPAGGDDPANLQAICRPCHAIKSSREGLAARNRK